MQRAIPAHNPVRPPQPALHCTACTLSAMQRQGRGLCRALQLGGWRRRVPQPAGQPGLPPAARGRPLPPVPPPGAPPGWAGQLGGPGHALLVAAGCELQVGGAGAALAGWAWLGSAGTLACCWHGRPGPTEAASSPPSAAQGGGMPGGPGNPLAFGKSKARFQMEPNTGASSMSNAWFGRPPSLPSL